MSELHDKVREVADWFLSQEIDYLDTSVVSTHDLLHKIVDGHVALEEQVAMLGEKNRQLMAIIERQNAQLKSREGETS